MEFSGFERFELICKDCGTAKISFTLHSLVKERSKGFSPPTRCPECAAKKREINRLIGSPYIDPRFSLDSEGAILAPKLATGKLAVVRPSVTKVVYGKDIHPSVKGRFERVDAAIQSIIDEFLTPGGRRFALLEAETGSGKTVWTAARMLMSPLADQGIIGVTQPRLSTLIPQSNEPDSNIPGFIAHRCVGAGGYGKGHEIGYEHAGDKGQSDSGNRLVFLTDGLVLARLHQRELEKFSVLIIDEAHEESLNMSLLFWVISDLIETHPNLRVVLASATIDRSRFIDYFGGEEIVIAARPDDFDRRNLEESAPKTSFDIADRWPDGEDGYASLVPGFSPVRRKEDIPRAAAALAKAIVTTPGLARHGSQRGNMVVFVPTISLVDETISALRANLPEDIRVIASHAQMSSEENAEARETFRLAKKKRVHYVVVTTTLGETGMTYPFLEHTIDSGMINVVHFDSSITAWQQSVTWHHKKGVIQRRGRVGRDRSGDAWRLYTKESFAQFPDEVIPEVDRSALDMFILRAMALGIDEATQIQWLGYNPESPKQVAERDRAIANLRLRGCIDSDGDLTPLGSELARFRVGLVDHARVLREADHLGCEVEMATFLQFLDRGRRRPFKRGREGAVAEARWRIGCIDDLELCIKLVYQWQKAGERLSERDHQAWSDSEGLDHLFFEELIARRNEQLDRMFFKIHTPVYLRELNLDDLHPCRMTLALMLPEWVMLKGEDEKGARVFAPMNSLCPISGTLGISRQSAAWANKDLRAILAISRSRGKNGEPLADTVVAIKPEWLEGLPINHPMKIIRLLDALRTDEAAEVQATVDRVTEEPLEEIDPTDLADGKEVSLRFLGIAAVSDDRRSRLWTAQDIESGAITQIWFKGARVEEGSIVRGHVVITEREEGVREAILSMSKVIKSSYPVGTVVRDARIVQVLEHGDVRVELEPGLTALVETPPLCRLNGWEDEIVEGSTLDLEITRVKGASVFGRIPEPAGGVLGKTLLGLVRKIIRKVNTYGMPYIASVFATIWPGVDVLIPGSSLRGIAEDVLEEGGLIIVTVTESDDRGFRGVVGLNREPERDLDRGKSGVFSALENNDEMEHRPLQSVHLKESVMPWSYFATMLEHRPETHTLADCPEGTVKEFLAEPIACRRILRLTGTLDSWSMTTARIRFELHCFGFLYNAIERHYKRGCTVNPFAVGIVGRSSYHGTEIGLLKPELVFSEDGWREIPARVTQPMAGIIVSWKPFLEYGVSTAHGLIPLPSEFPLGEADASIIIPPDCSGHRLPEWKTVVGTVIDSAEIFCCRGGARVITTFLIEPGVVGVYTHLRESAVGTVPHLPIGQRVLLVVKRMIGDIAEVVVVGYGVRGGFNPLIDRKYRLRFFPPPLHCR